MSITDFILARVAEDERAAREWYGTGTVANRRDDFWLAECDAKRRIVAEHPLDDEGFCYDDATHSHGCKWHWPCPTLRALAAIWADHADYDEAWR